MQQTALTNQTSSKNTQRLSQPLVIAVSYQSTPEDVRISLGRIIQDLNSDPRLTTEPTVGEVIRDFGTWFNGMRDSPIQPKIGTWMKKIQTIRDAISQAQAQLNQKMRVEAVRLAPRAAVASIKEQEQVMSESCLHTMLMHLDWFISFFSTRSRNGGLDIVMEEFGSFLNTLGLPHVVNNARGEQTDILTDPKNPFWIWIASELSKQGYSMRLTQRSRDNKNIIRISRIPEKSKV